jgi:hypothetical protein
VGAGKTMSLDVAGDTGTTQYVVEVLSAGS